MNMHRFKTIALAMTLSAGALLGTSVAQANSVDAVLKVSQSKTTAAQNSQKTVDKLASETGDLLQDYKTVMKQVDGLRVYNARLEKQIANQLQRIEGLGDTEPLGVYAMYPHRNAAARVKVLVDFIEAGLSDIVRIN